MTEIAVILKVYSYPATHAVDGVINFCFLKHIDALFYHPANVLWFISTHRIQYNCWESVQNL